MEEEEHQVPGVTLLAGAEDTQKGGWVGTHKELWAALLRPTRDCKAVQGPAKVKAPPLLSHLGPEE